MSCPYDWLQQYVIHAIAIFFFDVRFMRKIVSDYQTLFPIITPEGTKWWYKGSKLDRDNDQPAVIGTDGSQYWFKDGMPHRDGDQPALIHVYRT